MTSAALPVYPYTMQQSPQAPGHNSLEMSLREHLLAAGAGQPAAAQQQPVTPGPPSAHASDVHGHHNIDPAIAGSGYPMSAGEIGDGNLSESGRKGRRELSTSKRAAQNRAAQRAFRQRKEEYIKSLKDQVDDFKNLTENFKAVQSENYQLRDYIISLQSRLLESQGNYPEPPSNIDLSPHTSANPNAQLQNEQAQHQQSAQQQAASLSAPTAPMTSSAAQQLQQAAAQAAAAHATTELNNGTKHARSHDDAQYMPAAEYPAQKRQKSEDSPGMTSVQNAEGNDDKSPSTIYPQHVSQPASTSAPGQVKTPSAAPQHVSQPANSSAWDEFNALFDEPQHVSQLAVSSSPEEFDPLFDDPQNFSQSASFSAPGLVAPSSVYDFVYPANAHLYFQQPLDQPALPQQQPAPTNEAQQSSQTATRPQHSSGSCG